jgi:hypothetical protein
MGFNPFAYTKDIKNFPCQWNDKGSKQYVLLGYRFNNSPQHRHSRCLGSNWQQRPLPYRKLSLLQLTPARSGSEPMF